MSDGPIVVTNDDGIDSPGLTALVEALEPLGEVIVVAPAGNQSAVGRSIDARAGIDTHPLGYTVEGSPATCVVTAATALDIDPAIVVSGINKGANLGAPMLGRSGTVGAAVEAAYLGLPAVAVSAYVPFERIQGDFHDFAPEVAEFEPAAATAHRLTQRLLEDGPLAGVDYFNVNAPLVDDLQDTRVEMTEPAPGYFTTATRDGDHVTLRDQQFEQLHTGELATDGGTDRGVLADGRISVTPLSLPASVPTTDDREAIAGELFDELPGDLEVDIGTTADGTAGR